MSCRCIDMSNCSNDILKIGEIKGLFSGTQLLNTFVSAELHNLASNCMITFYSVNMLSLMTQENKVNEEMIDRLPDLINKCTNKIEALRCEYRDMSREDYDYHHRDDDDD